MSAPVFTDQPVAGFYAMRLRRGGLEVAVRIWHGLPIVVVVSNNAGWGDVRHEREGQHLELRRIVEDRGIGDEWSRLMRLAAAPQTSRRILAIAVTRIR